MLVSGSTTLTVSLNACRAKSLPPTLLIMAASSSRRSWGRSSVTKLYGRLCFSPAGISVWYLVAVRLRTIRVSWLSNAGVQRAPPTNLTVTGSGSSFENETSACVDFPLTSLMPKISAAGNEALTETARVGLCNLSCATSSSRGS